MRQRPKFTFYIDGCKKWPTAHHQPWAPWTSTIVLQRERADMNSEWTTNAYFTGEECRNFPKIVFNMWIRTVPCMLGIAFIVFHQHLTCLLIKSRLRKRFNEQTPDYLRSWVPCELINPCQHPHQLLLGNTYDR
jgi:hypothetical protein